MKTNFDPVLAQKAKRDLAEKLLLVGHKYLPQEWTFEYRKSLTGCCWSERKHIAAPRPVTRKSLYIWLHECAHAHLHSDGKRRYRVDKEYEAEQWAHRVMREEGIAVPRTMTKRAKNYVQRQIKRGEARGQKRINSKARKFAGQSDPMKD